MFAVLSSIAKGIPEEELDSDDLKPLLLSLRFFKAKYTHMPNQEDFFTKHCVLHSEIASNHHPLCYKLLLALMAKDWGKKQQRSNSHPH